MEVQQSSHALIYDVVRRIPRGRVATYGQVALLAGNPQWARVVGWALHVNSAPGTEGAEIPCHRVVNRFGRVCEGFAFGGEEVQRMLLEVEGIVFNAEGAIDLAVYGWDGKA